MTTETTRMIGFNVTHEVARELRAMATAEGKTLSVLMREGVAWLLETEPESVVRVPRRERVAP